MMLRRLMLCFPKCLNTCLSQNRRFDQMSCLHKRDIIDPTELCPDELKTLMWTAMDLKCLPENKAAMIQEALLNYNATLIMSKPCIRNYVSVSSGLQRLGCRFNAILNKQWESGFPCDLGRSLSGITNLIFVDACNHENVLKLRDGASIPVICIDSRVYRPIKVLADLMTAQERFGYLSRLKVGWVGPPGSYLYTYLLMCVRLGMHIHFACLEKELEDAMPGLCAKALKIAAANRAEFNEYLSNEWLKAIYRAHLVVTTRHDDKNVQINLEVLKEAAVEWSFAHSLPRSLVEVSNDVIMSENSLVWDSCENLMWMVMAMALHVLVGYEPANKCPPDFEGHSAPMKI